MKLRLPLFALLVAILGAALLAACGGGPVRRVSPPTAGIQELSVLPDGRWKLSVRIENFSNVPMRFSAIDATLDIGGRSAGRVQAATDLDVPGGSGDVLSVTLTPAAGVTLGGSNIAYELRGTIDSADPKRRDAFERSSRLSPVPGLADTYR